jgi:hypothetical protein
MSPTQAGVFPLTGIYLSLTVIFEVLGCFFLMHDHVHARDCSHDEWNLIPPGACVTISCRRVHLVFGVSLLAIFSKVSLMIDSLVSAPPLIPFFKQITYSPKVSAAQAEEDMGGTAMVEEGIGEALAGPVDTMTNLAEGTKEVQALMAPGVGAMEMEAMVGADMVEMLADMELLRIRTMQVVVVMVLQMQTLPMGLVPLHTIRTTKVLPTFRLLRDVAMLLC